MGGRRDEQGIEDTQGGEVGREEEGHREGR